MIQAIHGVAHPGIRAEQSWFSAHFVCHGLIKDAWCRDRLAPCRMFFFCPRAVGFNGPSSQLRGGHIYLLTLTDRSTRWVEALFLKNMEASTCTKHFVACWVSRLGVTATVATDRGNNSTIARGLLCNQLGMKHVLC